MTGTLVEHLQNVLKKVSRTIGFLRHLQNDLPRFSLVIIYKSLIRQHLDYGNISCDSAFDNNFCERHKSMLYNAALSTTGAIKVSSTENFRIKFCLESL